MHPLTDLMFVQDCHLFADNRVASLLESGAKRIRVSPSRRGVMSSRAPFSQTMA